MNVHSWFFLHIVDTLEMHYCAKNELCTFMGWGILKPKCKLKMVEIAPNQPSTVQSDAKKTLNLATI